MNFRQVRINPNPEGSEHFKRWESECGRYVIEWRNRIGGVKLNPAYYRPLVKRVNAAGWTAWCHVDQNRRFLKLHTAEEACRRHAASAESARR
jgi:hypothetical protein